MFTVTDEDRRLRAEGIDWRVRCQLNLTQDSDRFPIKMEPHGSQEEKILNSSLGAIVQERTSRLRQIYREGRQQVSFRKDPQVRVLVSQRAIEEALARTRMRVMNERNVHKLIYRYVSTDFEVRNLNIDWDGDGMDLTLQGHRYADFYLTLLVAD